MQSTGWLRAIGSLVSGPFAAFGQLRRVHFCYQSTRHYANLYRQLGSAGTPIPTNDLWIAALVVQHDVMLYSRDAHFHALPQLPRLRLA